MCVCILKLVFLLLFLKYNNKEYYLQLEDAVIISECAFQAPNFVKRSITGRAAFHIRKPSNEQQTIKQAKFVRCCQIISAIISVSIFSTLLSSSACVLEVVSVFFWSKSQHGGLHGRLVLFNCTKPSV